MAKYELFILRVCLTSILIYKTDFNFKHYICHKSITYFTLTNEMLWKQCSAFILCQIIFLLLYNYSIFSSISISSLFLLVLLKVIEDISEVKGFRLSLVS